MRELIEQIEQGREEMGRLALQYGLRDLRVLEKSQELDELLNLHHRLGPNPSAVWRQAAASYSE